ncbi:MAG: hypothetical protein ACPG47_06280 [Leucothrix sp.]
MTQTSNRSTCIFKAVIWCSLLINTSLYAAGTTISQDSMISIVIAAMSGAAFVTAIWALLLGRKSMKKDRDFVNTLKQNIAKDQKRIDSSMRHIKKSEERAGKVLDKLVHQNNALMSKQHHAWLSSEKIEELAEKSEIIESDLQRKSDSLDRQIEQTQFRWDERLTETENTVMRVDQELREGLNHLDTGIKRVQQQDAHSYQLAQHITAQHNIQLSTLEANNELSEKVKNSLNQTLKESTQLLDHLRENQEKTDNAYTRYMESIGQYEGDLYNQYDIAFQNADMARQELDANLSESRLHVESLRRYEEQSRFVKENTEKNLKQLDVKSINQLADTLSTTQQTFENLSRKVTEAQQALKSLNNLDLSHAKNAMPKNSHQPVKFNQSNDSTLNDDNTLIPFFTKRKG